MYQSPSFFHTEHCNHSMWWHAHASRETFQEVFHSSNCNNDNANVTTTNANANDDDDNDNDNDNDNNIGLS